ncbi:MAG TPA: hypothetical protein ENK65_01110 [Helicobacteraceae bacterium]|nr:hypothetical protein [Helicobacteraceae bacterium]
MKLVTVIGLLTVTLSAQTCYEVVDVEADDVLNIRAQKTWKSEKVGEIPHYEKAVVALKCEGGVDFDTLMNMTPSEANKANARNPGWCWIVYDGKEGWASKRYLVESKCPSR